MAKEQRRKRQRRREKRERNGVSYRREAAGSRSQTEASPSRRVGQKSLARGPEENSLANCLYWNTLVQECIPGECVNVCSLRAFLFQEWTRQGNERMAYREVFEKEAEGVSEPHSKVSFSARGTLALAW